MEADQELLERVEARLGTALNGKWRLDSVLGIGGMAAVYAATHRNRKRAAIKVLHRDLSFNTSIQTRFVREGYVANTIDHPGVATVFDDDVAEDGCAYLVMDLLHGETVHARWRRKERRLPLADVVAIGGQLLDVLIHAHEKAIVHRDLKPENLFLDTTGQLKVLDFGIARMREGMEELSAGTRTGTLLGTPAFMAPEQARGRWNEVDARTDLWAVGATMFTLLTNRYVHEAETTMELLGKAMDAPAPALRDIAPDVPESVACVVDRALMYDKEDRHPDARSMRLDLSKAAEAIEGLVEHVPLPSDPVATAIADTIPWSSSVPPAPVSASFPSSSSGEVIRTAGEMSTHRGTEAPSRRSSRPGARSAGAVGLVVVASFAGIGAYAALRGQSDSALPASDIEDGAPIMEVMSAAAAPPAAASSVDPRPKSPAPATATAPQSSEPVDAGRASIDEVPRPTTTPKQPGARRSPKPGTTARRSGGSGRPAAAKRPKKEAPEPADDPFASRR